MARFSAFLGQQVDVQYRAGDILLSASGFFVGDSGRSIFLEQCFEQHGQRKLFRWEIPYPFIVHLARKSEAQPATAGTPKSEPSQETTPTTAAVTSPSDSPSTPATVARAAAS